MTGVAMTPQTVCALYDRAPDAAEARVGLVALATSDGSERWRLYSDSEVPAAASGSIGRGVQRIAGRPERLVVQEFSGRIRYLSEQEGTEQVTRGQDTGAVPVAVDAGMVYRIEAAEDGGRQLVAADDGGDRWTVSGLGTVQRVIPGDDRLIVWQQSGDTVQLVAYA